MAVVLMSATHAISSFTNAGKYYAPSTAFVVAPIPTTYRDAHHHHHHHHLCRRIFGNKRPAFMTSNSNDDNKNPQKNQIENESVESQINTFLDKPLFDPDSESNQNNWFANLVKSDYDAAEALYVGVIGIAGVIVSQELLRIVKNGAGNFVHFGGGGGNLF